MSVISRLVGEHQKAKTTEQQIVLKLSTQTNEMPHCGSMKSRVIDTKVNKRMRNCCIAATFRPLNAPLFLLARTRSISSTPAQSSSRARR